MCRSESALEHRHPQEDRAVRVAADRGASSPRYDVDNIYKVPLAYHEQGVDDFDPRPPRPRGAAPPTLERLARPRHARRRRRATRVRIALVGKYVQLEDAYLSVSESLRHAGYEHGAKIDIDWIDSEELERGEAAERLRAAPTASSSPAASAAAASRARSAAAQVAREDDDPVPRHLPRHADRRRRVRAPRRRHGRRELDRVRPRDAVPGDRPAARAEGGRRPRRDDAPRRRPDQAPRRHARPRALRRGRHLRAPPPPLRGQQPPAQAPRGGRPGRSAARRPTSASSRSSSCATTRSSSPRSSTPSSSRAPSARRRCSASSSRARARARSRERGRRRGALRASPRRSSRRRPRPRRPRRCAPRGRARAPQRALRRAVRDPEPVRARARVRGPRDAPSCATSGSTVEEDDAGPRPAPSAATCSRGRAAERDGVLLCAHLDTVPHGDVADRAGPRRRRAGRTRTPRSSAPTTRPRSR